MEREQVNRDMVPVCSLLLRYFHLVIKMFLESFEKKESIFRHKKTCEDRVRVQVGACPTFQRYAFVYMEQLIAVE